MVITKKRELVKLDLLKNIKSISVKILLVVGSFALFVLSATQLVLFKIYNSYTTMGDLDPRIRSFQILVLSLSLAVVLVVLLVLFITVRKIVINRIKRLTGKISAAANGDMFVRSEDVTEDEIGRLARSFNELLKTITRMNASLRDKELQLLSAENAIAMKAKIERQKKIIEEKNQELKKKVEKLSLMFDISHSFSSSLEMDEVLQNICTMVGERLGYDEFAILLLDDEGKNLVVKATYGFQNAAQLQDMTFAIGEGISGIVAKTKEPILIKDTSQDERYLHYKGKQIMDGSFLSIPMIYNEELLGVLNFSKYGIDAFTPTEIDFLKSIANQAAIAIKNAKFHEDLIKKSITDELTGIYNRRHFFTLFKNELMRAKRYHENLSILMIDIDHFKHYNDTNGHLMGDRVLKEVAQTLYRVLRTSDIIGRYGGEEFCVILPSTDADQAFITATKLKRAVENTPFEGGEKQPGGKITISIGVSAYVEGSIDTETKMIDTADEALLIAKRRGRNRVISYFDVLEGLKETEEKKSKFI